MFHFRWMRFHTNKFNVLLFILVLNSVFALLLFLMQYDDFKWLDRFLVRNRPLDEFSEQYSESYYINYDAHQANPDEIPVIYRRKPEGILNFIPPVPLYSLHDYVHRLSKDILVDYLKLKPRKYTEKILILTPIHNSAKSLERYARQLHELSYPHNLLSVAFGEDGSDDSTIEITKAVIEELKKSGFSKVQLFCLNMTGSLHGDWGLMHERQMQYKRRQHLAKARNLLLKKGLQNEDYVLWIDSDIGFLPDDLVEQLLFADKDVVVPACLYNSGKYSRIYDKNSWRETQRSLEEQKYLSKNQLVVEGYQDTNRIYLSHLRAEGRIVKLDGVGGCALLVKAKCHRNGLNFPEKVFNHHLETEGLAKLALSMGYGVYGLPFLEVFHS